jgi:hypothetical protein
LQQLCIFGRHTHLFTGYIPASVWQCLSRFRARPPSSLGIRRHRTFRRLFFASWTCKQRGAMPQTPFSPLGTGTIWWKLRALNPLNRGGRTFLHARVPLSALESLWRMQILLGKGPKTRVRLSVRELLIFGQTFFLSPHEFCLTFRVMVLFSRWFR